MKRGLQKFSKEYLEYSKSLRPEQIVKFIEDFQKIHLGVGTQDETILISVKIKKSLLEAFKFKAQAKGLRYQTQLKQLMAEWLR